MTTEVQNTVEYLAELGFVVDEEVPQRFEGDRLIEVESPIPDWVGSNSRWYLFDELYQIVTDRSPLVIGTIVSLKNFVVDGTQMIGLERQQVMELFADDWIQTLSSGDMEMYSCRANEKFDWTMTLESGAVTEFGFLSRSD